MIDKIKILPSLVALVLLMLILSNLIIVPLSSEKNDGMRENFNKYNIDDLIRNSALSDTYSSDSPTRSMFTSSETNKKSDSKTIMIFNNINNNYGFLPSRNVSSEVNSDTSVDETPTSSDELPTSSEVLPTSSEVPATSSEVLPNSSADTSTSSPIVPPPTVSAEELRSETNRVISTYNIEILFTLPLGYNDFEAILRCVHSIETAHKFLGEKTMSGIGVTEINVSETNQTFLGSIIFVKLASTGNDIANVVGDFFKSAVTNAKLTANIWGYNNPSDFDPSSPDEQYNYNSVLDTPCYFLSSESQQSLEHEIAELSRAILLNDARLITLNEAFPLYKKVKILSSALKKKYPVLSENIIVNRVG